MSEVYGYPTILLSDGTREFIGGGNGEETDAYFQRLIRERLGDEAEDLYNALKEYWQFSYAERRRQCRSGILAELCGGCMARTSGNFICKTARQEEIDRINGKDGR